MQNDKLISTIFKIGRLSRIFAFFFWWCQRCAIPTVPWGVFESVGVAFVWKYSNMPSQLLTSVPHRYMLTTTTPLSPPVIKKSQDWPPASQAHLRPGFGCGHNNCRCHRFEFYVQQLGWEARWRSDGLKPVGRMRGMILRKIWICYWRWSCDLVIFRSLDQCSFIYLKPCSNMVVW